MGILLQGSDTLDSWMEGSGGFTGSCVKTIGNGVPEDTVGVVAPRSSTDSTEQLVWCLMNMWSMLYVISVICYLRCICVCTSYHCELVVGLRKQFWTLLLTFDIEDRGIQVSMVLDHNYIPHTFCDTLSHPSFRTFRLLELTTLI